MIGVIIKMKAQGRNCVAFINKKLQSLKICRHKNKSIIVIDGFASWEVTAIKCCDCKKIIKKNKNKI